MLRQGALSTEVTHLVRDACLCLHVQRAARALARRFDKALKPAQLTNWQFSLLMSLNREEAPKMGTVADLLAVDRTTLTANLKPLERRVLVKIAVDRDDKRSRRLYLTAKGKALLERALPLWEREHSSLCELLSKPQLDRLRADLRALSEPPRQVSAVAR
jgi:DNA-binding MarR family transcriptional regulator